MALQLSTNSFNKLGCPNSYFTNRGLTLRENFIAKANGMDAVAIVAPLRVGRWRKTLSYFKTFPYNPEQIACWNVSKN